MKNTIGFNVTKTTPEISGNISDTDISFGDNISNSIITAIYRNPYTKMPITGTQTWDISGIPPVSFGANKDFSSNTGIPQTIGTFRPVNLLDISNHNNVSFGPLSVYIKATTPKNMSYNNGLQLTTTIGTSGSSNTPKFNNQEYGASYDYGGMPLTYKIRAINKTA
jgi:hypothetical protein